MIKSFFRYNEPNFVSSIVLRLHWQKIFKNSIKYVKFQIFINFKSTLNFIFIAVDVPSLSSSSLMCFYRNIRKNQLIKAFTISKQFFNLFTNIYKKRICSEFRLLILPGSEFRENWCDWLIRISLLAKTKKSKDLLLLQVNLNLNK